MDQMSSSNPQRPTPFGVDIHLYPMTTRPGPGSPESPHQPPPAQSHPQQPTIAHASDRTQESTGCVEDWLDILAATASSKPVSDRRSEP
ncbi:hypothetical protein I3842_06G177000 [Carya illinoinensis]|uniref:Uncharacterized protein n=1 Tax=Carya illinoinensis TaxID=32201 RepID=A0A922EVF3_CARIL|nr:hypothetical protein I3842_06G177000 [Carya illinoinensis]